jgi:hypothetical protein
MRLAVYFFGNGVKFVDKAARIGYYVTMKADAARSFGARRNFIK